MTDPSAHAAPPERTMPWRAVAAAAGVVLLVAVLIAAVALLNDDVGTGAIGSGSPAPSASVSPSSAETVTSSAGAVTPSPSASAQGPAAIPETWTETAVYSEPGKRYVLGDLMAWSDGIVAVGTLYEDENRNVFGPPPPRSGRVWRSTDGTDWTDVTPVGTFADFELAHLFEAADGALIVIGQTFSAIDPVSAAWETRDGEAWTPIELAGLADGAFVLQVASGAQGHVASTYVVAEPHPLYSADGRSWEQTLEAGVGISMVAAGEEGFVATTFNPDAAEVEVGVVASADGLEWFDSTEPNDGSFLAAPHGADWLATTSTFNPESIDVDTWGSANGLDWSPLGQMEPATVEIGDLTCHEAPAVLHGLPTMAITGTVLLGPCGEGAVMTAGSSYASLDGVEWTPLPFGDRAYAAGAATIGDRVVIATDARTNRAPVIGVTFWISESP